MGLESMVCCMHKLNAFCIDITLLVFIIIGLASNLLGLIFIKWNFTSETSHILYIISLVIYVFCLSINIIFIIERKITKRINKRNNKYCMILSFVITLIDIIGLIFNIICLAITWKDYHNIENYGKIAGYNVITKSEKRIMICLYIFSLVFFILQIPCWISLLIRLHIKTNGKYSERKDTIFVNVSVTQRNQS